jgi:hypothetical protein
MAGRGLIRIFSVRPRRFSFFDFCGGSRSVSRRGPGSKPRCLRSGHSKRSATSSSVIGPPRSSRATISSENVFASGCRATSSSTGTSMPSASQ